MTSGKKARRERLKESLKREFKIHAALTGGAYFHVWVNGICSGECITVQAISERGAIVLAEKIYGDRRLYPNDPKTR